MIPSILATRDGRKGPAFGVWVKLSTIESTEIMAAAGFDFCVIDLEHTLFDTQTVYQHIVVGSGLGLQMLVRIPDSAGPLIQRVLDAGAFGVVAPHVDTANDALRIAQSCTFPPVGTRGSGGTSRAGQWGLRQRDQYLNDTRLCIPQIESSQGAQNIEDILRTPGVGSIMLGPADLGLDRTRDPEGPSTAEMLELVRQAARAANIPIGTACNLRDAASAVHIGYDFIVCGNDASLLAKTAQGSVAKLQDLGSSFAKTQRLSDATSKGVL
jgi:2-keto-3-deoxy-L-rhamnonate aldolase RhmA